MKFMKTDMFQFNSLPIVFITFTSTGLYSQSLNIKTQERFKFAKIALKIRIYCSALVAYILSPFRCVTIDEVRIGEWICIYTSTMTNLHTLHINTAPSKTFTSLLSSSAVPWQRLLTLLILHALRSSFHSYTIATLCFSEPPVQTSQLNICYYFSNCSAHNISSRTT
jgi:hypothetical protein